MSTSMKDRAAEKKCAPTSQRTGGKLMTTGTWQTGNPMAMGMQQTGVSPMAVGARGSGNNSRAGTAHSY